MKILSHIVDADIIAVSIKDGCAHCSGHIVDADMIAVSIKDGCAHCIGEEHKSVDEQLQGLWEMRWIAGKSYDVELRWTIHSIIHQIAVALCQMMNWCTNMYSVYVTDHHDHVHYMHHHQLMQTAIFANKLHKGSNHHTKHAVANAGHIMIISPAFI